MSVKAYSQSNNEDELLTMFAQGALLSMGRIMGSYLYMARINFGGIQSEFLLWCDDLYIEYTQNYAFTLLFMMILKFGKVHALQLNFSVLEYFHGFCAWLSYLVYFLY